MLGFGTRFLIDGSKKDLIESFFIFLIDRIFAVISSKKNFPLNIQNKLIQIFYISNFSLIVIIHSFFWMKIFDFFEDFKIFM